MSVENAEGDEEKEKDSGGKDGDLVPEQLVAANGQHRDHENVIPFPVHPPHQEGSGKSGCRQQEHQKEHEEHPDKRHRVSRHVSIDKVPEGP